MATSQSDKVDISVRQRPLRLEYPSPRMDELDLITEDHDAYELAAFAFHHPDRMAQGQWVALLSVWPRKKGRRPNYFEPSHAAQAVDRHGAAYEDIAEASSLTVDGARKIVARGREPFMWQSVSRPAVIADTGSEDPSTLKAAPNDPEDADAWNDTLLPTGYFDPKSASRSFDALERATAAIQRSRESGRTDGDQDHQKEHHRT